MALARSASTGGLAHGNKGSATDIRRASMRSMASVQSMGSLRSADADSSGWEDDEPEEKHTEALRRQTLAEHVLAELLSDTRHGNVAFQKYMSQRRAKEGPVQRHRRLSMGSGGVLLADEVAVARQNQADKANLLSAALDNPMKVQFRDPQQASSLTQQASSPKAGGESEEQWPPVRATFFKPEYALRNPSALAKELSNSRVVRYHEEMAGGRSDVRRMIRLDDSMNPEVVLKNERQELMCTFQRQALKKKQAAEAAEAAEARRREEQSRRLDTKASNATSYVSTVDSNREAVLAMSMPEAVEKFDDWLSRRVPGFKQAPANGKRSYR